MKKLIKQNLCSKSLQFNQTGLNWNKNTNKLTTKQTCILQSESSANHQLTNTESAVLSNAEQGLQVSVVPEKDKEAF